MTSMLRLLAPLTLDNLEEYMVLVEGGTFDMGGVEDENEQPVHKVCISDFYMCSLQVTFRLWREIMVSHPVSSSIKDPARPVEGISWDDIQDLFLPSLRSKTRKNYRLPYEAEWEYAACGGQSFTNNHIFERNWNFSGSNHLLEVAWSQEGAGSEILNSGFKRPNRLGIYDMSGNLDEWVYDTYDPTYYQTCARKGMVLNPVGSENGVEKVVRGGSWATFTSNYFRCSNRYSYPADYREDFIGFRLCLDRDELK